MEQVTVNQEQELYVIPTGYGGYSCLGFDVALKWGEGVAAWCGCPLPDKSLRGTVEGYADYERIIAAGAEYARRTGSRCPALLSAQLIPYEGKRVEVETTYGETRRFIVGKSTGWLPIHLEVKTRASSGGCGAENDYKSVRLVR